MCFVVCISVQKRSGKSSAAGWWKKKMTCQKLVTGLALFCAFFLYAKLKVANYKHIIY